MSDPGSSQLSRTQAHTRGRAPVWAEAVATYFGCGYGKPGPGTWGSVGALLTWSIVVMIAQRVFGGLIPQSFFIAGPLVFAALATVIGIPAATQVARAMGGKDPSKVVIDEVAGQMLAIVGAAFTWKAMLAGFILFRAFDITKPFPIRRLEKLPEGTGIVVDDLGAGVYALIVMIVLRHWAVV